MSIRSSIRAIWRLLRRIIHITIGVSLPIFIFPVISGVQGGILFFFWFERRVVQNTNSLALEVELQDSLSYWNVPGALSIHDFMDEQGPFHIPKLTTLDWHKKLEFLLPNEHVNVDVARVDELVSFDGLVRIVDEAESSPDQYWVYVTSLPELKADPWDAAFSTLLQELNVNPLPLTTDIFYLDCASSGFLCGVWAVKHPSMVHFVVENETLAERKVRQYQDVDDSDSSWLRVLLAQEYTYNLPDDLLFPVTVRIIELPLEDDAATSLLARNTLPTPLLQLHSLISDPDPLDLVSHWDTYSPDDQTLRRFQEHVDRKCETRGTWWYHFTEWDKWYTENVLERIFGKWIGESGGWLQTVQNYGFTITVLATQLVALPCRLVCDVYGWYFGLGWDGEPANNIVISEALEDPEVDNNMWEDMMADFWDVVGKNLSAQESENAARAAVTES